MGETSREEEKAEVRAEQNDNIKEASNYLTLVKEKNVFFSQTHDCAWTGKSVHNTGKQPVHHQSAEESIGPFGQGACLTASLQACDSNYNLQYSYNKCKVRSYWRQI